MPEPTVTNTNQRWRGWWDSPLRKRLWESGLRVPWLIAFNVAGVVVLIALFALTAQGEDLLRICAEVGFGRGGLFPNTLFLLGTLVGSVAFWYSSRLLLGVDYAGYPLDPVYAMLGRRWWPRLLGAAVPLAIGWTFTTLTPAADDSRGLLAWLYLGMGVLLFLFYVFRRPLLQIQATEMIEQRETQLPLAHRRRVRALLLASFALLVAFMALPVVLPQAMGAPAIAVLGVAGISLFGIGILTWLPMSRGAPPLTLAALLLALVAGTVNDNHGVRVVGGDVGVLDRPQPAERLAAWGAGQPAGAPVILVASSGGGIRAAYWTATTLAWLEEHLGAPFAGRLFAISGVSGGSLGAATYVTLKRAGVAPGGADGLLASSRTVLGQDFLAPVVAGLLFPDLVQRFVPVPIGLADRQRFLEKSWEAAFDGAAVGLFRGPFVGLYDGPEAARLPSLLLNTTLVSTGQRAVISNLRVAGMPEVLDLLEPAYGLTGIRTSAAAGASARFTYVSPAGTVPLSTGGALRLVDGGYFENSGTATLVDLLVALRAAEPGLRPILLVINNDPEAPELCQRPGSGTPAVVGESFNATLSELTAPGLALLATRSARGALAEVNAADLVDALGGAVIELPLAAVVRERMDRLATADVSAREDLARTYAEPPLGWSLSAAVRHGMDETLDRQQGDLDRQVRYLAIALGLESGTVPPCRARGAH